MAPFTFINLTRGVEIGANCYALDLAGKRVVLDCGMHPRHEGEMAAPNVALLDDQPVDAIFISHAHHDHLGSLPVLQRRHPEAPVLMTEATRQLSDVMLHNSVNVMVRKQEDEEADVPLFTHREVNQLVRTWRGLPLGTRFDLNGERLGPNESVPVSIELFHAGHILGSAGALIEANGQRIFYTGDVQFDDQTIMSAAQFPEEPVDVLIMESTRGDTPAPEGVTRTSEIERLRHVILETFANGGGVLIPTFALGKTQEILAILYEFKRQHRLGRDTPIYIGGLGAKLTNIHDRLAHQVPRLQPELRLLDEVAPYILAGNGASDTPMKPRRIYAISSGMMTEKTLTNVFARKVLSHPEHTLIFIAYADPESPAGIVRATPHGEMVQLAPDAKPQPLNCRMEKFNFSGHATRETLRAFAIKMRPKKVLLVHGDPAAVEWFRATLSADLPQSEIIIPTPGVPLDL